MKTLFFLAGFILIHIGIAAQVSAKVEIDDFDGTKTISTEYWIFGENEKRNYLIGKMLSIDDGIIALRITSDGDLGCFIKGQGGVQVKLTNGTIIEFAQMTPTNCDSEAPDAIFWPLDKTELNLPSKAYETFARVSLTILKNYDWETIRIHTSKSISDFKPCAWSEVKNPEQFFRQHIAAIEEKMGK